MVFFPLTHVDPRLFINWENTDFSALFFNKINQVSPQFYVDSNDPPMYLAHGLLDCLILYKQSEDMSLALDVAGVFNILDITEDGFHFIGSLDVTVEDLVDFLEIALGNVEIN